MDADREIFAAGDEEDLRLTFACTGNRMGILVYHFMDKTYTDFYLKLLDADSPAVRILNQAPYVFSPILLRDRILAVTDLDAPNLRVVEVQTLGDEQLRLTDVVPTSEVRIQNYLVTRQHLIVCYLRNSCLEVIIYDFHGNQVGTLPVEGDETVSLLNAFEDSDEILLAAQSFAQPSRLYRYTAPQAARTVWINSSVPFDGSGYIHRLVQYSSHDGTRIPIFLFGREDVVEGGLSPTIMTSYGGFGIPMTPQFSVFVAFMVERGCLFAVPSIRGGSDLGVEWHNSAKRQNRMTAYGDFLAAAEWLVSTGRSSPSRMAIFGGSNSGLLVGAAMTQRPDLFRAVVCMAPLLDMLRYHLFDDARFWKDEFGTADREDDFAVLSKYSPYHQVRDGIHYPATLIVSGDADRSCNPLHARKMTARLQAANASPYPVLLAYDALRGHSPVLPLTERVAGLTDRMAFLCDQLQLSA
jgi:prolyl oligopeptidase